VNHVTFLRKVSAAVALASLFAAAPAFAGNRDGFAADPEPERTTPAASHECASCPRMARDEGSGGDAASARSSTPAVEVNPFDREMDAGG
jgi:hypothetical protein